MFGDVQRSRSSAPPTASRSTTTGNPQYSTFSLCAIDPATGQSGAARDHARAVRRPRRAARARRRRRRLHAGLDDGRVRTARARPAGQGRRAAGGARAAAGRRSAARVAAGRRDRHEGPRGRAHRQEQRQLGRQPAGAELHRAGQHHGRSGGRRGRGARRSRRPTAPACRSPSA